MKVKLQLRNGRKPDWLDYIAATVFVVILLTLLSPIILAAYIVAFFRMLTAKLSGRDDPSEGNTK